MNYEKIKTPKALYNSWKHGEREEKIKALEAQAKKNYEYLCTLDDPKEWVDVKWLLDVAPKKLGEESKLMVSDAKQMVKLFKACLVSNSKKQKQA